MLREYKCLSCGVKFDSPTDRYLTCMNCGSPEVKRVYTSVQLSTSAFKPHFNYSVGQYVNNDREFKDALKRGADVNSEKTGIAHDYTPFYPSDIKDKFRDNPEFENLEKKHVDRGT